MGFRDYLRRIQAARHEEQAAQAALDFDYEDRIHHDGPWDEDQTYLRLNTNVHIATSALLDVLRRRVRDGYHYPWPPADLAEQVGMILRHIPETGRGHQLANAWDRLHGIDTADIEVDR